MGITNMFKRYLEDKWEYGGGGCILLAMKNLAPANLYFPDGATTTEVTAYTSEGTPVTINSANWNKLFIDFKTGIGNEHSAGPSDGVGSSAYPGFVETEDPVGSNHQGFGSGYLIPMFVPEGWKLVNGTKGCVLDSAVYPYNSVPENSFPIKKIQYSNITNDSQNVNGVTKVTCIAQNKTTAAQTLTHIMLLSSRSPVTNIVDPGFVFTSVLSASSGNTNTIQNIRNYPDSAYGYVAYWSSFVVYYLDDTNKMHRLYKIASSTSESDIFDTKALFDATVGNFTNGGSSCAQIVAPMIIEELDTPVTLQAGDAYKIEFTLDLSNREDWIRKRSDLEEGIYYYSGTPEGTYPALALEPEF